MITNKTRGNPNPKPRPRPNMNALLSSPASSEIIHTARVRKMVMNIGEVFR
jgi:hypothetical protein